MITDPAPVESVADFDPWAPEFLRDPCAGMQVLLRESPAFHHEPTNAYYVLPYAEVRDVLADWEVYSNVKTKAMPVRDDLRHRIPVEHEHVGTVAQNIIANLDPPAHTPQRRAAQRTFSHRRIRALGPEIERIADGVIDDMIDRGTCDILRDFAQRVTLRVVASLLLDIPDEMLPGLHAWTDDLFRVQAPIELAPEDVTIPDDELVVVYDRLHEAYRAFSTLVEQRAAEPGQDLASAMLTLTDDGGRVLSNDQVLGYMIALIAAGTDTTANLIVNMVRYFTEDPGQLRRLREDPGLWDNAVAEGLRRSAIAQQKYRISKMESEVLGMRIPAGARVCVSMAAANSDPGKFPDPLRFDVARPNAGEHLGLGRGRHFCLGAPVVIPEARIALQTLYARIPDLVADLDHELTFLPALETRAFRSQPAMWSA